MTDSLRALAAVRLLTALRLENPFLYAQVKAWATKGESKNSLEVSPMYHRFSPYNFPPERWWDAAERLEELYKLLCEADEDCEKEHAHKEFDVCNVCARRSQLQAFHDRFLLHFGRIWAKKAMELCPRVPLQPKKQPEREEIA